MMKNLRITDCYVQLILSHTESYGVISLHELKGNGVSHAFELAWISVRRDTRQQSSKQSKGIISSISIRFFVFLLHQYLNYVHFIIRKARADRAYINKCAAWQAK